MTWLRYCAPPPASARSLPPVSWPRSATTLTGSPAQGLRAFAGTAPVTRASGRSRFVNGRRVRNKRRNDACHWWAFSMLTKSSGARAHYDRRKAAGDSHNAALRHLANKLIGRLWWCLQHGQPWDETTAWPTPLTAPTDLEA